MNEKAAKALRVGELQALRRRQQALDDPVDHTLIVTVRANPQLVQRRELVGWTADALWETLSNILGIEQIHVSTPDGLDSLLMTMEGVTPVPHKHSTGDR